MMLWTRTAAFGVVRTFSARPPTNRWMASSTSINANTKALLGIDFLSQTVVDVLNDTFDPKDVARGSALAKLDKGKKKKKKKKKNADEEAAAVEPEDPELSDEEKQAIGDAAAAAAKPFGIAEAMVTPATRPEFGDYQVNAAMGLAKAVGMSPR
jgi:hypothetical protein